MTEQYQCQSYSDDNRVVQDCMCGKCGNTSDTEWETQVCKACGGDGFTVEYDPRDQTGNTPMQAQCDYCHAEGRYMTLDCVRELLTSRDTYWKERVNKDNLMGMIVKNSTGFDTVGNQRLWHLDIDAFESDLDILLDNLK